MPREYFGPTGPTGPPEPPRRPPKKSGTLEYPEEPCGTCGQPLLRRYTDFNVLGRDDPLPVTGEAFCRNGCAVSAEDINE